MKNATVKYEANRCENYHSRKSSLELEVDSDKYSILAAMELCKAIVDFKLDGVWSIKRKELMALAESAGQTNLLDELDELF